MGPSGYDNPNTGRPAAITFFSLNTIQNERVFEIRYTDESGLEEALYEFEI